MKAILGLTRYDGELRVLGRDPATERDELLRDVSFIADTAVLPKWLRVRQALDYVEGVHPSFQRDRAEAFIARTELRLDARVKELSKGMVTQLHLALVLAIRARLLVLDEPTLGLDLLYRRRFYDTLLNDYMDEQRTILVTTHQVEEIENILTDVLFIEKGRIVLDSAMDDLALRFAQVFVAPDRLADARALGPMAERTVFGRTVMLFDNKDPDTVARLGEVSTPSVADLFVATMQEAA